MKYGTVVVVGVQEGACGTVTAENPLCCVVRLGGFNDWGGRGCNKFVTVLGGNDTKIAPTVDIFDQPPGQMR